MLDALIKIVGADRLLMGSDWPIGDADKRMIKGDTVARLTGIAN